MVRMFPFEHFYEENLSLLLETMHFFGLFSSWPCIENTHNFNQLKGKYPSILIMITLYIFLLRNVCRYQIWRLKVPCDKKDTHNDSFMMSNSTQLNWIPWNSIRRKSFLFSNSIFRIDLLVSEFSLQFGFYFGIDNTFYFVVHSNLWPHRLWWNI